MDKTKTALIAGLLLAFASSAQAAHAQYGGSPGTAVTEEQIAECQRLGIDRQECNEHNILAARRVAIAHQNPASGSGTPMISLGGDQAWVFIGMLGAVFGGVAAAFFVKGRMGA
jgi:hypothetical protein